MDSGIMARLKDEDPLLACHDRTAGCLRHIARVLAWAPGRCQVPFVVHLATPDSFCASLAETFWVRKSRLLSVPYHPLVVL